MQKLFCRRTFIASNFHWLVSVFSGAAALQACSSKPEAKEIDPCSDMSMVDENNKRIRSQAAYVEKSPVPEKYCHNCKLYIPSKEKKACGRCLLFTGPVAVDGYCVYWAAIDV